MKLTNILIFSLFVTFAYCQSKNKLVEKNYELIADDDGILVEKFDSTIVDENKYNYNNTIYKIGNSFKYNFEHVTPTGEIKFFKVINDNSGWEFVEFENTDSTTIKSVIIEVANGNPMADHIPDYNQTALVYKIGNNKGYSMSGAIENEANVWIHPPRDKYFEILELNPFPYIKAPYKIGTKWTWNLGIGDHWADGRWKMWEGQIENEYKYEITDKRTLKTDLGEIECFVIESKAKSRIGETELTAYFNLKYGFVKLNYTNIDGSKTNLELTEHSEKKNDR
tara:strand:+ start:56 stop:898 length:843 start_codon:yes stop_codon:yes gene_type:complete